MKWINLISLIFMTFTFAGAQALNPREFEENEIIMSGTGSLIIPSGTTGQRPTPVDGMFRYNTTDGKFEWFENSAWVTPTEKVTFSDDEFEIYNLADPTKTLAFDASALSPGTPRTFTLPDASGIFALLGVAQSFTAINTFTQDVLMTGTGQFQMPVGTTAQRSGAPLTGMSRYNTDLSMPEIYNGVAWVPMGAATAIVGPAGATDNAIVRFDGVTGLLSQNSNVLIDDDGRIAPTSLGLSTMLGFEAGLNDDLTNNENTSVGYQAGRNSTTGMSNVFMGYQAGRVNNTGTGNVYIGSEAGETGSGSNGNVGIGERALQNQFQSAGNNTAVGKFAQRIGGNVFHNTSVGAESLENNIGGRQNTAMGYQAGTNAKGGDNVLIGFKSGGGVPGGAMARNTFIGTSTGDSITTGSDNILVGNDVDVAAPTDNFKLNIGNTIYGDLATDSIGIGVAVPTVELDVLGSGKFTGNLVSAAGNSSFFTISTAGDAIFGGIGQIDVPSGTTLERAAVPDTGMIRFNTDFMYFEGYNGAAWVQMETGAAASGDVVGPLTATDNALVRYDGITGKIIQDSSVLLDDSDNMSGIVRLDAGKIVATSITEGSHPCPTMTEVQRDAIVGPVLGDCVINSDTSSQNIYDGAVWVTIGSGGLNAWVTGTTYIIGNIVYDDIADKIYKSTANHVAGATFAGDIANWDELSDDLNRLGSSTDEAVVVFDGTSGDVVQETPVTIGSATGNMTGVADFTATGTTTLAVALGGPLKATAGVVSASAIDLTSEITGILPIANGGTNSSTALSNNFVMESVGGAIVESSTTSTELGFLDATSSIQTQLDGKLTLAGESGGQVANGGLDAADALEFHSTAHATKGNIDFGTVSANSGMRYDEVNDRLSIHGDENDITIAGSTLGSALTVHTEGVVNLAEMTIQRHTNTSAFGSHVIHARSRGDEATETVVQDSDSLARVIGAGHDGTDYAMATEIRSEVDGVPGAGDMPGRLLFMTSADGSETPLERMRISANGDVDLGTVGAGTGVRFDASTDRLGVGVAAPTVALDIAGALKVTSTTEASAPCPSMTEVQRDLLSPSAGDCVYNSTSNLQNQYNGSFWISILGSSGVPLMSKGSLFSSNGVLNGEFTACADGESLEWDVAETTGFKCVTIDHTKVTTKGSIIIGNGSIEVQQAACPDGQILQYSSAAGNGVQCAFKTPFTGYTITGITLTAVPTVKYTNVSGGPLEIQIEHVGAGSSELYWQDGGGHRHFLLKDITTVAPALYDVGAHILPAGASIVGYHTSGAATALNLYIFDL